MMRVRRCDPTHHLVDILYASLGRVRPGRNDTTHNSFVISFLSSSSKIIKREQQISISAEILSTNKARVTKQLLRE